MLLVLINDDDNVNDKINDDDNVDDDSLRGDSFLSTEPLGHWPKGETQLKLYRTRIARIHAAWTRVGPLESTC